MKKSVNQSFSLSNIGSMETVYGTVYGTLYTSVFGRLAPGLELTWQNLTIKTDFCSQFDIIRAGFRDAVVCSPLRGLGHGTAGPGEIHDCKEFCSLLASCLRHSPSRRQTNLYRGFWLGKTAVNPSLLAKKSERKGKRKRKEKKQRTRPSMRVRGHM